ncbi:MAG: terminase family protein [Oscillospiraceae bacterium]
MTPNDLNIIWQPQPRQELFMKRWEDEALYGGAAGGGKSDCALIEATRQVGIPHYRALILRKTYPQLSDLIDRSLELYPIIFPGARYNDSKHVWTFPSGAKLSFGSLQHAKDRFNYQGKHYDFIDFDELTQFSADEYDYLKSRNRPNGPGTRCYMRAQANPGGIGHGWVKARFVSPAKPMDTIWQPIEIVYPDGRKIVHWESRIFVPSNVFDNKILLANDPMYLRRLANRPEAERNALLYGSWDSFEGQVFVEWRNDPEQYDTRLCTHVISPFRIPDSWAVWRGFDWGYSRPFSVGWYAVDHDKRLYRIRELYGCNNNEPNVGVKWEPRRVAQEIRRIEGEDVNLKGRRIHGVADPAIFADDRGTESIAALMERDHVWWEPADHARINGKMQVHNRLAFDDDGIPMLYVFDTCKHFIRTIPNLVYDSTDVEDVDTDGEDHIYDELRYLCMANPIAPRPRKVKEIRAYNPLDDVTTSYDKYAFYRL